MPPETECKLSVYVQFLFLGKRGHHFHQIIKVIYNPKERLQELRGIPVIHFIPGLKDGVGGIKGTSTERADLFPLFTLGKQVLQIGENN